MALESLTLEDDEQIVSLDVKSSYTNVSVGEAIEIALRELYLSNIAPDIPRSAMKSLLRLFILNVMGFGINNQMVWLFYRWFLQRGN